MTEPLFLPASSSPGRSELGSTVGTMASTYPLRVAVDSELPPPPPDDISKKEHEAAKVLTPNMRPMPLFGDS